MSGLGKDCTGRITSSTISHIKINFHQEYLWAAHTAMSSRDRQKGIYSIGLTVPWKLGCSNKKKKNLNSCTMPPHRQPNLFTRC